ncbi:27267_t:CDS:1, partial [Gigaspora margarita]
KHLLKHGKKNSNSRNFSRNYLKKNKEKEVIEENFWSWNEKEDDYLPYLASIS